jgi:hypothetical protein
MKKLMLSVGLVTVLASTAFAQGGVTQTFRECRSSDDGQFFWNIVTYNIYPNPAPTGSREVMEMENTGEICMASDYEQARRFAALYGEEWTASEELDAPTQVVEALPPEPVMNYSNVQNQPMVDEQPPAPVMNYSNVQNQPMVDEPPPANSYASYQHQGNQYQNQGNQYQNQGNQYQNQPGPNYQFQRPMMQPPITTNHPAPGARFIPPTTYRGQYFGSAAPRKVATTRTATRGRVRAY